MGLGFFVSILLLYIGSEALIRGGSSLALRLNIKPLVVGLTVVAFSTSSPELVVSIKAALTRHGDISAGDIIGSNIFNVAGILSFCALFKAIPLNKQILKFDLSVMFLAYFLFSVFLLTGKFSRLAGIIFVSLLIIYTLALYYISKNKTFKEKEIIEEIEKPLKNIYFDLTFIVGGLSSLVYGAHLLVTSAIYLAKLMGINEASVALGVVAVSTSLPEVSCCLIALRRKKYDILVGNIIGSNIFNIFSVVGIASLVTPIEVVNIRLLDLGMMFLTGVFLFPFFQKKSILYRSKAAILFCFYLLYTLSLHVT
jgi:cation:H+ antiporter